MSNISKWFVCVGLILVAYCCANAQARPNVLLKKSWRIIEYGTSDKKYSISDKDTLVIFMRKPILFKNTLRFMYTDRSDLALYIETLFEPYWRLEKDEQGAFFVQSGFRPLLTVGLPDCSIAETYPKELAPILDGICTVLFRFRIHKEAYKKEGFIMLKALESDDYIKMVRFFG
jgi:hypothetical protein